MWPFAKRRIRIDAATFLADEIADVTELARAFALDGARIKQHELLMLVAAAQFYAMRSLLPDHISSAFDRLAVQRITDLGASAARAQKMTMVYYERMAFDTGAGRNFGDTIDLATRCILEPGGSNDAIKAAWVVALSGIIEAKRELYEKLDIRG